MKPPILLKTILDILFLFLILGTILFIVLLGIFIWNSEGSIPFEVNGQPIEYLTREGLVVIGFVLLSRILFLYIIFRFKRLVRLFFKGDFFSKEQVRATNIIGRLIVLVALLDAVPGFIYKVILKNGTNRIGFDFASVDSFWFILALGLFFMFLGKIFDNARILKEENELTV